MTDILVIDDDLGEFRPGLEQALRGYPLHFADSGSGGLDLVEQQPGIGLVLLDIKMPPCFADVEGREGIETLRRIKRAQPDLPVIMLTVLNDVDLVVEAIQAGAFHYIVKPLDRDKLRDTVRRALALGENAELRAENRDLRAGQDAMAAFYQTLPVEDLDAFEDIVGSHPKMRLLYAVIKRSGDFPDRNVAIIGETGVGKELVARAVAKCARARRGGPFVQVNCGAMTPGMLEDELFGHVKNAFTGADKQREGLFVAADGGTVYLDEVGEMPQDLQVRLLRVLQNGEVKPLGSDKARRVDVRVICTTHRDLVAMRDNGDFREDLFYRLWQIPVWVPPLRERAADIPRLLDHLLRQSGARCPVEPAAIDMLCGHSWPGNVRELENKVGQLLFVAGEEGITEAHVRQILQLPGKPGASPTPLPENAPETREDVAAVIEPNNAPSGDLPDIGEEYVAWVRCNGMQRLTAAIEMAREQAEGGSLPDALRLLGIPQNRYSAFRKFLHRNGIRMRDTDA